MSYSMAARKVFDHDLAAVRHSPVGQPVPCFPALAVEPSELGGRRSGGRKGQGYVGSVLVPARAG